MRVSAKSLVVLRSLSHSVNCADTLKARRITMTEQGQPHIIYNQISLDTHDNICRLGLDVSASGFPQNSDSDGPHATGRVD
jgi:hypothetical protein